MKNLLVFATFLLISCFQAVGQQMEFNPADSSSLILESLEECGSNFIAIGYKGTRAYAVKTSSLGGNSYGSVYEENSRFNASAKTPNGDIVAVGQFQSSGLISRISSSGVTFWAKSLSLTDSTLSFRDVQTTSSGDIVAVGVVQPNNSGLRREMIVLMSGSGNVLWATALSDAGGTRYADKVLLKGDSVLVFGTGQGNYKDVSISVFRLSDGVLLTHYLYGYFDHETLLDVVAYQNGFYLSFTSGPYSYPIIARLDENFNLAGSPVTIYPFTGIISGGVLSVAAGQLLVSGSSMGMGPTGSYSLSINLGLTSINWIKRVTPGPAAGPSPATSYSKVLANGKVAFVDAKNGVVDGVRGSVVTVFDAFSGTPVYPYCEGGPESFNEMWEPIGFSTFYRTTQNRTQLPMTSLSIGNVSYLADTLFVESCMPILLPVELISFIGEKQGETSVLRWQTASEHQTSHFKVFRSKDMEDWKEIGTVDAAGESQQLLDYRFVDENPLTGDNFYRLETVDIDDSTEYSDVVVVSFDFSRENFVVYPNPAKAGEWVTVKGEFQTVEAYDQTGRQVPFQRNGNQLALQEAGLGVYLLTFVDANGVPQTVRIVMN